ncbi:UNVERIFIED_ORG: cysteine synthase, partial [Arthrobacter globiformis]|nr:cysteine synthase [Arthrobacter globiformis]MDP9696957.1 cysteine synthase [Arthrobacter globiformis]
MPIIKDPHLFNEQSLFVDLEGVLDCRLYLKIEGFNFAGSIKLKPAREMV